MLFRLAEPLNAGACKVNLVANLAQASPKNTNGVLAIVNNQDPETLLSRFGVNGLTFGVGRSGIEVWRGMVARLHG